MCGKHVTRGNIYHCDTGTTSVGRTAGTGSAGRSKSSTIIIIIITEQSALLVCSDLPEYM